MTREQLFTVVNGHLSAARNDGKPYVEVGVRIDDLQVVADALAFYCLEPEIRRQISGLLAEAQTTPCVDRLVHEADCARICSTWRKKLRDLLP